MNIVIVNTEEKSGGAARAAFRLHLGLQQIGCDSLMFVERGGGHGCKVKPFIPPTDLPVRLRRFYRHAQISQSFSDYKTTIPGNSGLFSDDRSRYGASILDQIPGCDVINLHWIAGFIDYQSFFSARPKRKPIFWTLHDMNPFTGGCHYNEDCVGYLKRCGACPQLGSKKSGDLSRKIWCRKKEIYDYMEPSKLQFITPSRWLAREAERSALLGKFPITVIPNSLDTKTFFPRDKKAVRKAMGISDSDNVLLFVSHSTNDRRKGFGLLRNAINRFSEKENLLLISIGQKTPQLKSKIRHIHLNYIENDLMLSLVYSAADIFVISSLQDNFPNTVLESMSCGTPVVGFDTGGMTEMVRNEETGLLVPAMDVDALSRAIHRLVQNPSERQKMSSRCREIALKEFSLEVQAKRYVELYESMMKYPTT
jgi:glycosyltransferase involved in cell wall biosynthesis